MNKLDGILQTLTTILRNTVSWFNFLLIVRFFRLRTSKYSDQIKTVHKRKLSSLGADRDLSPCNPDKTVHNYSSVCLSNRAKILLAYGLEFCLPVFNINFINYFLHFEKLYHTVSKLDLPFNLNLHNLKLRLRGIAYKYFYNFKGYKIFSCIFSKKDIKELKVIAENKDIIVCRPDKGRGVVLLDREVYLNKMKSIISDTTKFTKLNDSIRPITTKIEDKLNNFLRKLKRSNIITDETYKQLSITGSGPGILYGLPKIHKPNFDTVFPFRPIFAAYNTASYSLGKFIVPILSHLTTNCYTIANSYSFAKCIQEVPNADKLYMCSFDIQNLFTNVPLSETINICLSLLFPNQNSTVNGMNKTVFKQLLEHSSCNSIFLFNGELYKQIDGVGMGLPHSPTFANIFLCYHENVWLNECPLVFKPIMYKRYVDDTFLLFKQPEHASSFLTYLNNKHPNITFTYESEINNSLPFLDVNITRSGSKFTTSVYRKQTFSGLGISFFSFCSFNFKLNAIKTLIHRAYHICSNHVSLHREIEYLKDFFR